MNFVAYTCFIGEQDGTPPYHGFLGCVRWGFRLNKVGQFNDNPAFLIEPEFEELEGTPEVTCKRPAAVAAAIGHWNDLQSRVDRIPAAVIPRITVPDDVYVRWP